MATISARVPDEIRRQGVACLQARGATVSDLVNAAFNYVIQTGELPGQGSTGDRCEAVLGPRKLSKAQAEELRDSLATTTFAGLFLDEVNVKEALAEGRRRDYETLS